MSKTFQSTKFKFVKKTWEIKNKGVHSFHTADVVKAGDKFTFKFQGDKHTEVYDSPEEAFKGFCLWYKASRTESAVATTTEPIQTEEQEEEIKAEADLQDGEAQAVAQGVHLKGTQNGIEVYVPEAPLAFEQPTQAPEVTPTSTESEALQTLKKLRNYTQFCAWVERFGAEYRLFRLKDGEAVDNHQPYKGDGTVVTLNLANGSVSRPFARVIHRYFELVKV